MKAFFRSTGAILLLLAACSCGPKKLVKGRVDIVIPRACLTSDVVLKDCRTDLEPPQCKHAIVKYKSKACEQIPAK